MVCSLLTLLLAWQPGSAALRAIFEENLARHRGPQAARDLGLFLAGERDLPAAARALKEAVRMDEETFGPEAEETLRDVAELAGTLPPEQAEPLWLQAAGSTDAAVASRALDALGSLREAKGDRAGAAALFRRALAAEEAAGGTTGARVAVRLNALALAVSPHEALPLLRRALLINRRVYGPKHPETAATEANLCGLLLAVGSIAEAVRMGSLSVAAFEATLGEHPRTASAASNLADALRAAGNRARAEQLYRRALKIDRDAYGPGDGETLIDARNLAEFLRDSKRVDEALKLEAEFRIRPPYGR